MSLQFIRPSVEYKESYLEAIAEFDAAGEVLPPIFRSVLELAHTDFSSYVERIHGFETGRHIEGRFSNHLIYWIAEGGEYVGHISIRTQLNEKLLQSGGNAGMYIRPSRRGMGIGSTAMAFIAEEAKRLGMHKLLYTCEEQNIPSRKMIEKAGGQLENIIEFQGKNRCRYWIEL